MMIRLIKQNQEKKVKQERVENPTPNQLMASTKAWVEEYRAKKARNNAALLELVKSN